MILIPPLLYTVTVTVTVLCEQYLFVLTGHDVGHTQVGQDHSADVQDLHTGHTHSFIISLLNILLTHLI